MKIYSQQVARRLSKTSNTKCKQNFKNKSMASVQTWHSKIFKEWKIIYKRQLKNSLWNKTCSMKQEIPHECFTLLKILVRFNKRAKIPNDKRTE